MIAIALGCLSAKVEAKSFKTLLTPPTKIKLCSSKYKWNRKYKMCVVRYASGCNAANGPYTLLAAHTCKYDDGVYAFTFYVQ